MSTVERAHELYTQACGELESNQELGVQLLTEAAALGNAEAAWLLHTLFFMADPYRTEVESLRRGMGYLQQAVDAGHGDAMAYYSLYLANGMFNVPRDMQKSFELATAAAGQGNGMAHTILASLYRNGQVVARDAGKVVEHLEYALAAGDLMAGCYLGDIYAGGLDAISADEQKALSYYYYAAQAGHPMAQAGYARLLLKKPGCTEKEVSVCLDILENLAAEGNDRAMVALGLECLAGRHMVKNAERAEILFEQAAEMGNAEAHRILEQFAE